MAALLALSGCSSASGPSPSGSPTPLVSPSPSQSQSQSQSQSPTPSPTPSQSATATVDVTGATRSALTLFVKTPNDLNNPAAGYVWSGVAWTKAGGPLAPAVKARLAYLNRVNYFDDRHCGESYLDGTQFGLLTQPKVVSATPNADGTVTVVIARKVTPPPPQLTVVMTYKGGSWWVTDLASGTGSSASIFAAKPNC